MNPEVRGQNDPVVPVVEIVGDQGEQLFPSADVAVILDLPTKLKEELEHPDLTAETLQRRLETTAGNWRISYNRKVDLIKRDGYWLNMQRAIRQDVIRELRDGDVHFSDQHKPIREAIWSLAPKEMTHYMKLIIEQRDISEEEFIAAGDAEQPSRMARLIGLAPRLYENTPENLDELREIADGFSRLTLLREQSMAHGVLDLCSAFGSRRDIRSAIHLTARMRKLAFDETLTIDEKIELQMELNAEVLELGQSLPEHTVPSDLHEHVATRVADFHVISKSTNLLVERALALTIYGRQFRLNGNQHPQTVTEPAQQELPQPEEAEKPATKPEKSEPEPKPDLLAEYSKQLHTLLNSVDYKQFELLKTKELKRRGLDEARAVLVKGENDLDGNVIVGGRSKVEATRYVSSIEFLSSFIEQAGGELVLAKQKLEETAAASAEHEKRLDELVAQAGERLTARQQARLKSDIPEHWGVKDIIAYIKNDWETASFVIKHYWPEGKSLEQNLHALLFLDEQEMSALVTEEAEVVTEPEPADDPLELIPDEEIIIDRVQDQNALEAIAQQLSEIILPAHATEADVKRVVETSGITEEQAAQIDWTRLYNLVKLRELSAGTMYRSNEGDLGNAPPYFVVAINFKGNIYAVAESPVEGNATYVISEKDCPGTWLEVLQLDKATARELGARRIIHRTGRATRDHLVKIQDVLIDMVTTVSEDSIQQSR